MCVCWNAYSRNNKAMLSKRAITANNRKQIYSESRDITAAGPLCVAQRWICRLKSDMCVARYSNARRHFITARTAIQASDYITKYTLLHNISVRHATRFYTQLQLQIQKFIMQILRLAHSQLFALYRGIKSLCFPPVFKYCIRMLRRRKRIFFFG